MGTHTTGSSAARNASGQTRPSRHLHTTYHELSPGASCSNTSSRRKHTATETGSRLVRNGGTQQNGMQWGHADCDRAHAKPYTHANIMHHKSRRGNQQSSMRAIATSRCQCMLGEYLQLLISTVLNGQDDVVLGDHLARRPCETCADLEVAGHDL